MGTNYYTITNHCGKCGRRDVIHLGKSSGGWQFSFQFNGGKFYKNVREMKKWLSDKKISDEYDEEVPHEEFWQLVKEKQKKSNHNHAALYPSESNMVIDGYSFSDGDFS